MSDASAGQLDPCAFPRRLLLAVVGLTPQVVTETLYALVMRQPPFLPTDLHLITTAEGTERIQLQLLDAQSGALHAFAADYAPGLANALARPRIDVLAGADGAALEDIETAEDGMNAADRILQIVRQATADQQTAICASIAGGRKTMGFLLGYAMSLFGRPQDRLTHVLVNPTFQNHPGFFYPPPQPRILFLPRDNRPVRTDSARVTLTDIPFVRLRGGLPHRLLDGSASFADTIAEAQDALAPPDLVLDIASRTLSCRGRPVILPPVEFAFVLWLARRRLGDGNGDAALSWRQADAREFLEAYARLPAADRRHGERIADTLRDGIPQEWFEQRVTRINKLLNDALGLLAGQYRIQRQGQRPHTRFGLPARLGAITIRDTAERGAP